MRNTFIVFNDKTLLMEGDRCLFAVWRLSLTWFGSDRDCPHYHINFNLTDAWVEVSLGRLNLAFYKKDQEYWRVT